MASDHLPHLVPIYPLVVLYVCVCEGGRGGGMYPHKIKLSLPWQHKTTRGSWQATPLAKKRGIQQL